ncbi:MAG TPA: hypothetical protein PKC21_04900 [Oligoflexia bacterium]|nr:hypothetical protein [Oligoflexia bacterium]HMR24675.1 hypothetical protein [Oligoflexia bacterium]
MVNKNFIQYFLLSFTLCFGFKILHANQRKPFGVAMGICESKLMGNTVKRHPLIIPFETSYTEHDWHYSEALIDKGLLREEDSFFKQQCMSKLAMACEVLPTFDVWQFINNSDRILGQQSSSEEKRELESYSIGHLKPPFKCLEFDTMDKTLLGNVLGVTVNQIQSLIPDIAIPEEIVNLSFNGVSQFEVSQFLRWLEQSEYALDFNKSSIITQLKNDLYKAMKTNIAAADVSGNIKVGADGTVTAFDYQTARIPLAPGYALNQQFTTNSLEHSLWFEFEKARSAGLMEWVHVKDKSVDRYVSQLTPKGAQVYYQLLNSNRINQHLKTVAFNRAVQVAAIDLTTAEKRALEARINIDLSESLLEKDTLIRLGVKFVSNVVSPWSKVKLAVDTAWIAYGAISLAAQSGDDTKLVPYDPAIFLQLSAEERQEVLSSDKCKKVIEAYLSIIKKMNQHS